MAEAEDVVVDVARHATVFARRLWARYRAPELRARTVRLDDAVERLELLIQAVFGRPVRIRCAGVPAPATLLERFSRRSPAPRLRHAVPATDDRTVWLPEDTGLVDEPLAQACLRAMALSQAERTVRGSATWLASAPERTPLVDDVYLLLEAWAAEQALVARVPGLAASLAALRRHALANRPPLTAFAPARRALEQFVRVLLEGRAPAPGLDASSLPSPADAWDAARDLAVRLTTGGAAAAMGRRPLLQDWWTGALVTDSAPVVGGTGDPDSADAPGRTARTARMARQPTVRDAGEDEANEEERAGPWMVQMDQPHAVAEDPMGLVRPTDRDDDVPAEELGEMVSELREARLVRSPGQAREILLSPDPPAARTTVALPGQAAGEEAVHYPEWDFRSGSYGTRYATVRIRPPESGPRTWVETTRAAHRALLAEVRRRFEALRAERVTLRRREDGEALDLAACVDSLADFRAGRSRSQAVYQTRRPERRNLAITLLIDVSGSTDGWISQSRRIIDVEREALLLVCEALDGLREAFQVQAFSGNGPGCVTMRMVKDFEETYSDTTACRIAALEPEDFTRAGAAIRHATAALVHQPVAHRLLVLLSDGKPNDHDEYEGRYGVEDMRQAVSEARLQGVSPFCLTIDRQAPAYLPRIFGVGGYAILNRPEALPVVLLDWLKRLITR